MYLPLLAVINLEREASKVRIYLESKSTSGGFSLKGKHELGDINGLLIEYGRICHIVKLPFSMIRPFSLVNNAHITLYPQLEIIWKVSKSLRKYWGKYGQISFYIISCIMRDCIIVEHIFLA